MNINKIINFNTKFKIVKDDKHSFCIRERETDFHICCLFTDYFGRRIVMSIFTVPESEYEIAANRNCKEIFDTFEYNKHVDLDVRLIHSFKVG